MIVCADDFGLAPDIDEAILALAEARRISAVSCMVALGHFDRKAFDRLLTQSAHLDLGLHLTLTEYPPLVPGLSTVAPAGACPAMGELLRRGIRRALSADEISRETQAQYEQFFNYSGRVPDYVDSHLHVHQFPGVREGVLRFLSALAPENRPYVRNSAMTPAKSLRQGVSPLKCMGIGFFGERFRAAACRLGLKTNTGFAGIYAYDGHEAYPRYLDRFVACMEGPQGILMTHPGRNEPWRDIEFRTLMKAEGLDGRINRFSASA